MGPVGGSPRPQCARPDPLGRRRDPRRAPANSSRSASWP